MPEPALDDVLSDPQQVYNHIEAKAAELRQQFGALTIRSQLKPENDCLIAEPVWASYEAIATSMHLPEFFQLCARYAMQRFDISWQLGFQLRTPGKLFNRLPVNEPLVFPSNKLPTMRASVLLRIMH